jgi:cell division inhibitor SulA/protein ImuA
MPADSRLTRLLEHPAIWRGRNAARLSVVPTGFAALDARLPGNGWPQVGLVEILLSRIGIGEIYLLLPALAQLTSRPLARWCAWIAPPDLSAGHPLEPFAPALAAHGITLSRVLVVRSGSPLWACEQALGSGACEAVLTWMQRIEPRALRRLQLATERGRTLGFLLRTLTRRATRESSCAALRLTVEPAGEATRLTLLKSRGGLKGSFEIDFRAAAEA